MILVADSDSSVVLKIRKQLYDNGLPSVGCTLRTVDYHMQKGIFDLLILPRPTSTFAHRKRFCERFRRLYPNVPTVMLVSHDYDDMTEIQDPADLVIRAPYSPVSYLLRIDKFMRRHKYRNPLELRVATVMHDLKNAYFRSFHVFFKPTATQTAILHTIFDRHPLPILPEELLKLSARPGTCPRLHTLSPHICRLNRLAFETIGRNVIGYRPKTGYYAITKKG